jgi:hypothetical protein
MSVDGRKIKNNFQIIETEDIYAIKLHRFLFESSKNILLENYSIGNERRLRFQAQ